MDCLYDTQGELACDAEDRDRIVSTLRRSPHYRANLNEVGGDREVDEVMHMRVPGGHPPMATMAPSRRPAPEPGKKDPPGFGLQMPPLPTCLNAH